jgi:hypothetical protein
MKLWFILLFGLLLAATANGSVIFGIGNTPQIDEPVLYHDSCVGCVDGPGNLVIGHLQSSNLLVHMISEENIVTVDPGHNAVSSPLDVGFDDVSIFIPGYTFTSIILNLTELSSAPDGTVTFTAHTLVDGVFTSVPLFVDHTGGNFYVSTTDASTRITELDVNTDQWQHDISQIRIGGAAPAPIPEPVMCWLTGFVLAGAGLFRRHRH